MIKKNLIYKIVLYQKFISPILGTNCRFFPSCSSFAINAISKYGIIYGLFRSIRRLLKCHPYNNSNYYDPA